MAQGRIPRRLHERPHRPECRHDHPAPRILWIDHVKLWTGAALLGVVIYVSFSGLKGVVYTDVFQFLLAMAGSIALAIYVLDAPEVCVTGSKPPCLLKRNSFRPSAARVEEGATITLASFLHSLEWYGGRRVSSQSPVERLQRAADAGNQRRTLFFSVPALRPDRPLRSTPVAVDFSRPKCHRPYGSKGILEDMPSFISYEMLAGEEDFEPMNEARGGISHVVSKLGRGIWSAIAAVVKYNQDYRFGYIFIMRLLAAGAFRNVIGLLLCCLYVDHVDPIELGGVLSH